MLNRRNFFNKLGSFVVGCYLASGLKPLESLAVASEVKPRLEINPAWMNAEYELAFIYNKDTLKPLIFNRNFPFLLDKVIIDPFPVRFNKDGPIKPYREYKG